MSEIEITTRPTRRSRAGLEATMARTTPKVNLSTLSPAERKKLATAIAKLRGESVAWDGDDGICVRLGIAGAPVGRKLMREIGYDTGNGIRASYDHRAAAKAAKEAPKPKVARKPRAAKKTTAAK